MGEAHVVFGAGGNAGSALVRALAASGEPVRAVTRSGRGDLAQDFPGVEEARADARDPEAVRRACSDAGVIYHCINVPYAEWDAVLPGVLDNLITAAREAEAPLVYCDNLYLYGEPSGPMAERHPPAARSRKGKLRARLAERLLEAHASGRVRGTIGRASDFFGPAATNTVAGQLVFPAVLEGKRAYWIGSLDVPHTLNYIDDVAGELITLGSDARALGEVWHLPAAPPVTGREFIQMVFEEAGRASRIGVHRRWMMRLAGLFNRQLRETVEVLYQFERPFVLDAEKFTSTFGDPHVTPMREAVAQTLAWERTRGQREAVRS